MEKGDITLMKDEITHLQNAVRQKFTKLNPDISPKWNSALDNYEELKKSITKVIDETDVGVSFLRGFFYYALKSEKDTFRISNINALSLYALGEPFKPNIGVAEDSDNYENYLYYIEGRNHLTKSSVPFAFQRVELNSVSLDEIYANIRNSHRRVGIYVSKDMLTNEKGARLLMYLLSDNLMVSLVEYKIKFFFDDSVKYNIGSEEYSLENNSSLLSDIGKTNYIAYWKTQKQNYEKTKARLAEISEDFNINYDDFIGRNFYTTLTALAEILIRKKRIEEDKYLLEQPKTNSFQPFIQDILKIKPVLLERSYKNTTENKDLLPCYFLCVISYEDYFVMDEKEEMLNHFFQYNNQILKEKKKHDIVRIFTCPGKMINRNEWCSAMKEEQNKLLFLYSLMNFKTGGDTYLFFYDEKSAFSEHSILFYQDYVVRIPKGESSSIQELFEETDIFTNDNTIGDELELYLSYPEDNYGNNRLLITNNKNSSYLYYQDFKKRFSCLNSNDSTAFLTKINDVISLTKLSSIAKAVCDELLKTVDNFISINET